MKLTKTFLFAVISSVLPLVTSAALPVFSQQTIELPSLTLRENAKASLHPFERSEPAAPLPAVIVRERNIVRADKFAISPPNGVDYKLLTKHPDSSVDYKLITKESASQPGK